MGSFLHPGLAWATLGLVSIPIIIHLINRRRFRRIDWAAMEYLLQALRKNRRRLRFEQLLLLLLRVALMALLGLAIARPALEEEGMGWLASAFRSEDKIFLLDDSFSTTLREAGRSVFEKEKAALAATLRRIAERSSGDRITILRGSRPRQPVVQGAYAARERVEELAALTGELAPTDTRIDLAEALAAVAEDASGGDGAEVGRPRVVSILSDLRAADWAGPDGEPNEDLARELHRLAAENDATQIVVLDAGSGTTRNVAITGVTFLSGRPLVDVPATLSVEVRNFSEMAVRDLGLRLEYRAHGRAAEAGSAADDAPFASALGPRLPEIAPGETRRESFSVTFRTPGQHGALVELIGAGDALPGDDRFPLAFDVAEHTEVLVINGEPSSQRAATETVFLEEALAPRGDVPSGIRPDVAVEENLPQHALDRYSVIFLANVFTLPDAFLRRLGDYVRGGGALVVFPGDQVDAAVYNRRLGEGAAAAAAVTARAQDDAAAGETPLLPARLGGIVREEDSPVELEPALDHPWFEYLREASGLLASPSIRFTGRFALTPRPTSRVLARFTDVDRSPAIVEGDHGNGTVVLFASSADMEWNDWPRHPTYLITLERLVAGAVHRQSDVAEHLAGTPVRLPVDLAEFGREARLRPPDYPSRPELRLNALPASDAPANAAAYEILLDDTRVAGLYAVGLEARTGARHWLQVAVRRDPRESDLSPLGAGELERLYPGVPLRVVDDAASFAEGARGRFEIADLLLWLFAGFLIAEGFLAWRFARHQRGARGAAR